MREEEFTCMLNRYLCKQETVEDDVCDDERDRLKSERVCQLNRIVIEGVRE